MLHPNFELHLCAGLPHNLGGVYRGSAPAIEALRRVREDLACRPEPQRFWAADDEHVVVLGRYSGTSKYSGEPFEAEFIHILCFENGKLATLRQVTDTQRWVEALAR